MLRVSQFNRFQPWQGGYYLAFNAATGAMAMMTSENFAAYQKIAEALADGRADLLGDSEKELLGQLQFGRFVFDSDVPEMDWLKFRSRKARFDTSTLALVIAPTMACNMACGYCFEGNKSGRMSPRVIESVLEFVEKRAPGLKELEISWYGGEPLLALDIMEDITESVLELAKEYSFKYFCAGVVTNGYLLTPETVDRLIKLQARNLQITIDGPRRIHNAKRPLKNGKESFDTIIANLAYAGEKIPTVVRVNLDKSFTPDVIAELLRELEAAGLRNKVGFYFGQLEPATSVCAGIADTCYESRAFSQSEVEYYRLLLDSGFMVQKLPSPMLTFCFAQHANTFLLDPDGDIYRCLNYAGDKTKSMGNIRQEIDYQHPEFQRLFSFDPFEEERCRSCEILPICMGGCPGRRADRALPIEEYCDSWKYNLQPMLELIAYSRQRMARAQQEQAKEETSR